MDSGVFYKEKTLILKGISLATFPKTWRRPSVIVRAAGALRMFINTTNSAEFAFLDQNIGKAEKQKRWRYEYFDLMSETQPFLR